MKTSVVDAIDAIHKAATIAALKTIYNQLLEQYRGDPGILWAIQDATAIARDRLKRKQRGKNPKPRKSRAATHDANVPSGAACPGCITLAEKIRMPWHKSYIDVLATPSYAVDEIAKKHNASVKRQRGKNPAPRKSRIPRKGVSKRAYVERPSQITRKPPTKRTRKRREMMTVLSAGGYGGVYPNPASKMPTSVYADIDSAGLTYGLDAVTPVRWVFASRVPKRARYSYGLNALKGSAAFADFIRQSGGEYYGSLASLRALLKGFVGK
jgi:hypothetical protein